jgi:hypothetical protein
MGATIIQLTDELGRPYRRYDFAIIERMVSRRTGLPLHKPKGCPCMDNKPGHHCVSAPFLATYLGTSERQVRRWRAAGMRLHKAEHVATALGRHPSEIWDG